MTRGGRLATVILVRRLSPPPWKVKMVEPIELRSPADHRVAIAEAAYNTFLLRSEDASSTSSPAAEPPRSRRRASHRSNRSPGWRWSPWRDVPVLAYV